MNNHIDAEHEQYIAKVHERAIAEYITMLEKANIELQKRLQDLESIIKQQRDELLKQGDL